MIIKKWTQEDIDFLQLNYPEKGSVWCAQKLDRTPSAVRKKASNLKISNNNKPIHKTTKDYEVQLKDKNIKVLESYINAKTAILHECSLGHQWKARPNHILSADSGCPYCAKVRIDERISGLLYYAEIIDNITGISYYKVGVTKHQDPYKRFRESKKRLTINIKILDQYDKIENAYIEEQNILYKFKDYKVLKSDLLKSNGNSELFIKDVLGLYTHVIPTK